MRLFLLALILISVPCYWLSPFSIDRQYIFIWLVVVVASLFIFSFKKKVNSGPQGNYFKHSIIIIIGYLIVHFQAYLDLLLNNIDADNTFYWVNQHVVSKGIVLSSIGFFSLLLGYLSYRNTKKDNQRVIGKKVSVNVLILFAFISLFGFFLTVNPLYLIGFYGTEDMGSAAKYCIIVYTTLMYAILTQKLLNSRLTGFVPANFLEYVKKVGLPYVFLLIIYLVSVLLSGDRGPLLKFGLLYLGGYFFLARINVNRKGLFALLIVGGFFISILGQVRQLDKSNPFTNRVTHSINTSEFSPSFSPLTSELSGSVRSVHFAIDYVPSKHDFFLGRFLSQNMLNVIPFSSNFYPLLFNDISEKHQSSDQFITWISQGDFPTYGEGTTAVADLYLDFGLVGVIFGILIFGWLVGMAEGIFFRNGVPPLLPFIYSLLLLSNAMYVSRSSVFLDFKNLIWIYLAIVLNKALFSRI